MTAPTVAAARPGMILKHSSLPPKTHKHYVISVDPAYEDEITVTGYRVVTNEGEWTFRPDERMEFPRRLDGSVVDWRASETQPYPFDLAIQDRLHPGSGPIAHPSAWPEWETWSEDRKRSELSDWEGMSQIVRSVSYHPRSPKVVTMTTWSRVDGMRRWMLPVSERVVFPRPETDKKLDTGYDSSRSAQLEAFGPYRLGQGYVFYAAHPASRGRWPKWLDQPIKIYADVSIMKPPARKTKKTSAEPWPPFLGDSSWLRHPRDPAWGKLEADQLVSAAELDRVAKIFYDYQARSER